MINGAPCLSSRISYNIITTLYCTYMWLRYDVGMRGYARNLDWHLWCARLLALLGRAERDHVGVGWTGMNRVHPDFAAAEVDRCRLGHAPQRPFGRGIGEGPGRALEAGDGGDIHDGSSARALHR